MTPGRPRQDEETRTGAGNKDWSRSSRDDKSRGTQKENTIVELVLGIMWSIKSISEQLTAKLNVTTCCSFFQCASLTPRHTAKPSFVEQSFDALEEGWGLSAAGQVCCVPHVLHKMTFTERLDLVGCLWELEVDTLAGQALVDLRVGVEAVVDATTLLLVEDDLEDLGAVLLGAQTLADNLNWVDEIGEDGVVDSGESSAAWALLGLRGAAAVAALWAWQDAAGSNDEHVAVGELLLELTGQAEDDVRLYQCWVTRWLCTYRCWERCQPWRRGTGTKMTIALRPWPTSICKSPGVSAKLPSAHRLFVCMCVSRYIVHVSSYSTSCASNGSANALDLSLDFFFHVHSTTISLPHGQRRTAVA